LRVKRQILSKKGKKFYNLRNFLLKIEDKINQLEDNLKQGMKKSYMTVRTSMLTLLHKKTKK